MHDLAHCLLSVCDVFTLPVQRSVQETCRLANTVTRFFSESSRSHFNCPIGCYHFEDVAAVAGNRRIECGRYSASVLGKTKGRHISKYPDILHKNILSFALDVV